MSNHFWNEQPGWCGMTEYELFMALRPHFPSREFALLPQVGNGTGSAYLRHCDALALGLWPSRGMRLHGFEIKTYRGDWTRELHNPQKAEEIAQYCNHWWIVAGHLGIVKPDELPPGWGLMEYDPEKEILKKSVPAPFKESKAVDLTFVAAMLRKAQEVVTPEAALAQAKEEGFQAGKKEGESRNRHDLEDFARLKDQLRDFQKASGVNISAWHDANDIGEAVRLVLSGTESRYRHDLKKIAESILKELA